MNSVGAKNTSAPIICSLALGSVISLVSRLMFFSSPANILKTLSAWPTNSILAK